jgi:glycosyltransferase involved in cell wall biosynthesis
MLTELGLDLERIAFVGPLPSEAYGALLQATDCHVHLTAPFVLSWSFLEAMSVGCPLVASDAASVREALGGGAGHALRYAGGSARGRLLHHQRGHYLLPSALCPLPSAFCRSSDGDRGDAR